MSKGGAPGPWRFFHNTELFQALEPEDDRFLGHQTLPRLAFLKLDDGFALAGATPMITSAGLD
jgi:hypothetical protein